VTAFDRPDDESAIKELLIRVVAAWDAGDAVALAGLYTCDASVVPDGSVIDGRDELAELMAAGFAGPLRGTRLVEELEHLRFATADVAIVNSAGGILLPGENTVRPAGRLRATWVLTRAGDGWLVDACHSCPADQGALPRREENDRAAGGA
jgi:uncharacterized protein (TIGR02246 family)